MPLKVFVIFKGEFLMPRTLQIIFVKILEINRWLALCPFRYRELNHGSRMTSELDTTAMPFVPKSVILRLLRGLEFSQSIFVHHDLLTK